MVPSLPAFASAVTPLACPCLPAPAPSHQFLGPLLPSLACSRPASSASVSEWLLVGASVSWPLLDSVFLTFLYSSPSFSLCPFIYYSHLVLVSLHPPSFCLSGTSDLLFLFVCFSPSLFLSLSFLCLSVSLSQTLTL